MAASKSDSPVQGKFPLGEGEGFYTQTTARHLHHGDAEGDAPAINAIQSFLNVPVSNTFDEATRNAVYAFQKKAKLPVTGIVDSKTWAKMAR